MIGVQALEQLELCQCVEGSGCWHQPVGCGYGGRQVLHVVAFKELQSKEVVG